jgi:hypothetical protein
MPPEVALLWSPPLCGDEQPEGTVTGYGAELAVDQVAAPPAGAPGGRVLQPADARPRTARSTTSPHLRGVSARRDGGGRGDGGDHGRCR